MAMKAPPHIGEIIREEVIEPLGLTVTKAAQILGVARSTLSALLNERADLSPEMATRIEKAFGPKMDHLLRMQLAHDIAKAKRRADQINVAQYQPA